MDITADMIRRYNDKHLGLYDPCIICGQPFDKCEHTVEGDTEPLIKRIKALGAKGRKAILDKNK